MSFAPHQAKELTIDAMSLINLILFNNIINLTKLYTIIIIMINIINQINLLYKQKEILLNLQKPEHKEYETSYWIIFRNLLLLVMLLNQNFEKINPEIYFDKIKKILEENCPKKLEENKEMIGGKNLDEKQQKDYDKIINDITDHIQEYNQESEFSVDDKYIINKLIYEKKLEKSELINDLKNIKKDGNVLSNIAIENLLKNIIDENKIKSYEELTKKSNLSDNDFVDCENMIISLSDKYIEELYPNIYKIYNNHIIRLNYDRYCKKKALNPIEKKRLTEIYKSGIIPEESWEENFKSILDEIRSEIPKINILKNDIDKLLKIKGPKDPEENIIEYLTKHNINKNKNISQQDQKLLIDYMINEKSQNGKKKDSYDLYNYILKIFKEKQNEAYGINTNPINTELTIFRELYFYKIIFNNAIDIDIIDHIFELVINNIKENIEILKKQINENEFIEIYIIIICSIMCYFSIKLEVKNQLVPIKTNDNNSAYIELNTFYTKSKLKSYVDINIIKFSKYILDDKKTNSINNVIQISDVIQISKFLNKTKSDIKKEIENDINKPYNIILTKINEIEKNFKKIRSENFFTINKNLDTLLKNVNNMVKKNNSKNLNNIYNELNENIKNFKNNSKNLNIKSIFNNLDTLLIKVGYIINKNKNNMNVKEYNILIGIYNEHNTNLQNFKNNYENYLNINSIYNNLNSLLMEVNIMIDQNKNNMNVNEYSKLIEIYNGLDKDLKKFKTNYKYIIEIKDIQNEIQIYCSCGIPNDEQKLFDSLNECYDFLELNFNSLEKIATIKQMNNNFNKKKQYPEHKNRRNLSINEYYKICMEELETFNNSYQINDMDQYCKDQINKLNDKYKSLLKEYKDTYKYVIKIDEDKKTTKCIISQPEPGDTYYENYRECSTNLKDKPNYQPWNFKSTNNKSNYQSRNLSKNKQTPTISNNNKSKDNPNNQKKSWNLSTNKQTLTTYNNNNNNNNNRKTSKRNADNSDRPKVNLETINKLLKPNTQNSKISL